MRPPRSTNSFSRDWGSAESNSEHKASAGQPGSRKYRRDPDCLPIQEKGLWITALDALRAEFEAKGVAVKEGWWGCRLLVVDDPDGNQLFFNYPNETASSEKAKGET